MKSKLVLHHFRSSYHFRSSSIKTEIDNVKECWKLCLQNKNQLIPAYKIKIYDDTESTFELHFLTTLNYFKNGSAKNQDTQNLESKINYTKYEDKPSFSSKLYTLHDKVVVNNDVIECMPSTSTSQFNESTHSENIDTANISEPSIETNTYDSSPNNNVFHPSIDFNISEIKNPKTITIPKGPDIIVTSTPILKKQPVLLRKAVMIQTLFISDQET